MSKKVFTILLALVVCLVTILASGCDFNFQQTFEVGSVDELYEATAGTKVMRSHGPDGTRDTYHGGKNNVEITNDFTIMTTDKFLAESFYDSNNTLGRVLEGMTLNGNGHTITIKGQSEGKFGRYSSGLFGVITNCKINDLTVVYDCDVNITSPSSEYFGGLCAMLRDNSEVNNCKVIYKRNTKFSFGLYGEVGGMFGYVSDYSKVNNCSVEGNLVASARYVGGLASRVYNGSQITNSTFDGSINAYYLEEAYVGGLVGSLAGTLDSSKVNLDFLKMVGEPHGWRSNDAYGGGLAGYVSGKLTNCYVDVKPNGYITADSYPDGFFSTKVYCALAVAKTAKGSVIKNVYVDGLHDTASNFEYSDRNHTVYMGICENNSTDVSNLYFVDDNYYYDYVETFTTTENVLYDGLKEEVEKTDSEELLALKRKVVTYSGTIHGEDVVITVNKEYDSEKDLFKPATMTLKIGDTEYDLETQNLFALYEFWYTFDNVQYIVDVEELPETNQVTVTFTKHHSNLETKTINFVHSYDEIVFDQGEEIIGGQTNSWKKDPQTSKWLLVGLD